MKTENTPPLRATTDHARWPGISRQDDFERNYSFDIVDHIESRSDPSGTKRPVTNPRPHTSHWLSGIFRRELPMVLFAGDTRRVTASACFASIGHSTTTYPAPKGVHFPKAREVRRVLTSTAPKGVLEDVVLPRLTFDRNAEHYKLHRVPAAMDPDSALAILLHVNERAAIDRLAIENPDELIIVQQLPSPPTHPNVLTVYPRLYSPSFPWLPTPIQPPSHDNKRVISDRTSIQLVRDRDGLAFAWMLPAQIKAEYDQFEPALNLYRLSALHATLEQAQEIADWTCWMAPEVAGYPKRGLTPPMPWPFWAAQEGTEAAMGDMLNLVARLETALIERGLLKLDPLQAFTRSPR